MHKLLYDLMTWYRASRHEIYRLILLIRSIPGFRYIIRCLNRNMSVFFGIRAEVLQFDSSVICCNAFKARVWVFSFSVFRPIILIRKEIRYRFRPLLHSSMKSSLLPRPRTRQGWTHFGDRTGFSRESIGFQWNRALPRSYRPSKALSNSLWRIWYLRETMSQRNWGSIGRT